MTTKTDFHSIMELKENFKPKERGWIDQEEAAQVKKVLELDDRTDIELQNIRDMAVMLYGRWSSNSRADGKYEEMDAYMDAMSAICAVVDGMKMRAWPGGVMNGKADENGNHLDGERSGADHQLL